MTKRDSEKDLTTKQTARQVGLSNAADVRGLIKLDLLPGAYKDGGTWRIPQSAIDSYKETHKTKSLSPRQRWEGFKSHPWIFWPTTVVGIFAAIALFFFAAISFGADFGGTQEQLYDWGIVHRFPPRREDETLIVIATFYTGAGDPDSDIQDALYGGIREQIDTLHLDNIRIQIDKVVIPGHDREQARQRARYHNASMIIWGDDTDFQVQTNFLNLDFLNLDVPEYMLSDKFINETERSPLLAASPEYVSLNETERTSLAAPPEYVSFVNKELKSKISFLSFFAIANASIGGNNEIAIQIFTHILDTFPITVLSELQFSLTDIWTRLGYVYSLDSNYALTVNSFSEVLSIEPENVAAYMNRGIAYSNQGNNEAALADFNQALELEPENVAAYNIRGQFCFYQDDFEAALADLNQALELDPENVAAYNIRGGVYLRQDDFEAALADFDQAVELDPENSYTYGNRGIIYSKYGNYEAALADFDQAVELDPENSRNYYSRGAHYVNHGNYEAALPDFNQALKFNPENSSYYSNRGFLYSELGDNEAALADLNQALELDPENSAAYMNRGVVYYEQGDSEKALADLRHSLELAPDASDRNRAVNLAVEELIQEIEPGFSFNP